MSQIMPREFIFCDVGARWGIEGAWKSFCKLIKSVSFEPDKNEYKLLCNKKKANDVVYQYALYKEKKKVSLNLTKSRGCSSIYKPNDEFVRLYPEHERFEIDQKVDVEATSLDILHKEKQLNDLDFIKIDVQGAELDVLAGGEAFLSENILGIEVEVEFHQIYENQPLFSDIDKNIREKIGLQLQDIRKTYWKYPQGINLGSQKGQLIFGDALYFRAPHEILKWCSHFKGYEVKEKILMACMMGVVYGYLDYSLCILNQPLINDYLDATIVENWKTIIYKYGKSFNCTLKGSGKIAYIFNLFYRMFQGSYNGWATGGQHLGSQKKIGIFK